MSCSHVSEGEYCPNARCQEEARALTDGAPIIARWPDPFPFSGARIDFSKQLGQYLPDLGGARTTMSTPCYHRCDPDARRPMSPTTAGNAGSAGGHAGGDMARQGAAILESQ